MARVLFIDNFDSFTYNLVDEFECLGHQINVVRNSVELDTLQTLAEQHDLLVISPGPGSPSDAGNCANLLNRIAGIIPVLGICLGHQLIVEVFGGKVGKAEEPCHGKSSMLTHHQEFCFENFDSPIQVGRYHSLTALQVPEGFKVLATSDDLVMSVYDPVRQLLGFQFHPESLLTTSGTQLLANSIHLLLDKKNMGASK